VHQNFRGQGTAGTSGPCREQMWLEDAGTSGRSARYPHRL
jgi:hypothetical protein